MSTIYIDIVANSPTAADNWMEMFEQGAVEKGMKHSGPTPIPIKTVNGESYHGREMTIEPAGQPIDFLDREVPDWVEVKIGVDPQGFTTEDIIQAFQLEGEEDTKVGETSKGDKKSANSDKSNNSDHQEGTDDTTGSQGQESRKPDHITENSTLEHLRSRAKDAAVEEVPETKSVPRTDTTEYSRSNAVTDYVKARADGSCEGCGEPAPFVSKTGDPYFHAHHIDELSDGGSDKPSTVIALCPNCHYRVHHGEDGNEYNERLSDDLREIEPQ